MKVYFIGVKEYIPLARSLSDYLSVKLDLIDEGRAFNFKFDKNDVIYPNYFITGRLEKLFDETFVVAPHTRISKKWDSKIYQSTMFNEIIPMPEFMLHNNIFKLMQYLSSNKKEKMVITTQYGNEGSASIIFDNNLTEVYLKYRETKNERFRTSKYFENSIGIAANLILFKDDIFIGPITQQKLDELKYVGGFYPPNINEVVKNRVKKMCLKIGEILISDGYLGLCGVDMIVKGDLVLFSELNPRKTGTAVAVSKMLNYSLSVLEYLALKNEKMPDIKINEFRWEI